MSSDLHIAYLPGENDSNSRAVLIQLQVPCERIVEFQAYFELHEALGIVRSLRPDTGQVGILTTAAMLPDCEKLIASLKTSMDWRGLTTAEILSAQEYLS